MKRDNSMPELSEDIEVIGPGQMLAEARKAMKLSQEDVAEKLNFRVSLVRDIEEDKFDKSLPATYNRGYLRNYAKLVNVAIDDILASYEMLGVAEAQGAEMQSFSKITEKQAQNNRLMWISYLIVAILIGSTVVWWLQDMKAETQVSASPAETAEAPVTEPALEGQQELAENRDTGEPADTLPATLEDASLAENKDQGSEAADNIAIMAEEENIAPESPVATSVADANLETQEQATSEPVLNKAIFTFAGDCWVNIYDATGERIAWGIKKAGYVMTISGVAPLKVTLGKPELVQINFDGQDIDMSQFNVGNIAKFSLPVEP